MPLKRDPSLSGRTARWHVEGGWEMTIAYDALCSDGVVRKVRVRQSPDTFFSHPGRTSIKGRAVRGFVSMKDCEYIFTEYTGT